MKWLSIILSLHVLLLTSFPMSMITMRMEGGTSKKSCCHAPGQTKKKDKKDCCKNCNPFMVCCNCFALTSQSQSISTPVIYLVQRFPNPSEANHANFLSEVWNPPKTA